VNDELVKEYENLHSCQITSISISPDNRFAWTVDIEGNVKVWKIDNDVITDECIIKDTRAVPNDCENQSVIQDD